MEKIIRFVAACLIGFAGLIAIGGQALAVPSLGVATPNYGYLGDGPNLEPYQAYFTNQFIQNNATEGFLIGPSGSDLIVFTNILGKNIYLLTDDATYHANSPTLGGNALVQFAGTGQFDGYTPTPYWGVNLGPVDGDWVALSANPFQPSPFYALYVQLDYLGDLAYGTYFFAVADIGGDGLNANGKNKDPFSPKTTSAVYEVPEQGTMLLLGSGLIILASIGRRMYKK